MLLVSLKYILRRLQKLCLRLLGCLLHVFQLWLWRRAERVLFLLRNLLHLGTADKTLSFSSFLLYVPFDNRFCQLLRVVFRSTVKGVGSFPRSFRLYLRYFRLETWWLKHISRPRPNSYSFTRNLFWSALYKARIRKWIPVHVHCIESTVVNDDVQTGASLFAVLHVELARLLFILLGRSMCSEHFDLNLKEPTLGFWGFGVLGFRVGVIG